MAMESRIVQHNIGTLEKKAKETNIIIKIMKIIC